VCVRVCGGSETRPSGWAGWALGWGLGRARAELGGGELCKGRVMLRKEVPDLNCKY